eukprot:CAMPEP_0202832862 /NCGR_PEP_ID=MMETSP1389-20130828/21801_1 /ASSEMBLY_ACC=CAM_ASM_000865 /TAXON_ID=302021 /ORGANISM="Rhodomonas sp., Strain CCMP768" /LENGTH=61 /DNA_ID=CAMNT_0049507129 /DNA_START=325 /DNA_END=506 /DNA_ORIENTATION=-
MLVLPVSLAHAIQPELPGLHRDSHIQVELEPGVVTGSHGVGAPTGRARAARPAAGTARSSA